MSEAPSLVSLMAWSSAHCTFPQNLPFGGKDELANAIPTKGNNTSAISRDSTPIVAPPVVFALSSVAQYSKNNPQQIFRTVLDSRPFAFPLAPVPAP